MGEKLDEAIINTIANIIVFPITLISVMLVALVWDLIWLSW